MNIILRKAISSDYKKVLKLKCQVHDFHYEHRPDFFKRSNTPFKKEEFDELVKANDREIYIVEIERNICGYVITKINSFKNSSLINDHKRFFIDDLCIDSSYRKKGIGRFLMKELESICRTNGYNYMDLNVWNFNTEAIEFYKKLGMKEIIIRMEKKIK